MKTLNKKCFLVLLIVVSFALGTACHAETSKYTFQASKDLSRIDPEFKDFGLTVVIEIPAATNEKWELNKEKPTQLMWDFKKDEKDQPVLNEKGEKIYRTIDYLSYPFNYGFVPSTVLPDNEDLPVEVFGVDGNGMPYKGDGDPLDVLVLGNALPRGQEVRVKLVGVMKFLDSGEVDDKLVAIHESAAFYKDIDDIDSFYSRTPKLLCILEFFFQNYKGVGEMFFQGAKNRAEAKKIIDYAIGAFKKEKK